MQNVYLSRQVLLGDIFDGVLAAITDGPGFIADGSVFVRFWQINAAMSNRSSGFSHPGAGLYDSDWSLAYMYMYIRHVLFIYISNEVTHTLQILEQTIAEPRHIMFIQYRPKHL